jgi:unsaturated rhamnogalacturonyl hydrolase
MSSDPHPAIADGTDPTLGRTLARAVGVLLSLPYRAWHFGDSVAFDAMLAADLSGDGSAGFARGFARAWEASRQGHRPLDCTAPGLTLCRLQARTGDDHLYRAAVELGTYLRSRRTISGIHVTWERSPLREPYGEQGLDKVGRALLADPGAGVFLDCLHFEPPLFAGLWSITGDERWLEAAVEQATAFIDTLQNDDGLFHHFYLESTGHRYAKGWGRGQGWALLGLLDVIELIPHTAAARLRTAASSLCRALVATQHADGQFDAVVGDPTSGPETSTAAFMASGFLRAARLDLGPDLDLVTAARRALLATLAATDASGILTGVSAEVFASTSLDHYRHVPRGFLVPWGQGALVLALAAHHQRDA